MKSIRHKKLSKWKTIIITDINTSEEKRFELDENQRLISKVKPNRRKHIPRKYIKIRFTEDHVQKRKKLNMILNHLISPYIKNKKKKIPSITQNKDENSLSTQETLSTKNVESLFKDLSDNFPLDSDDSNILNESEMSMFDEFDLFKF